MTDEEIDKYFCSEITTLADECNITDAQCRSTLKSTYDGYLFHPNGVSVYNPYSLLT
ncbi:MAG: AAA family ATPase [Butyrivibrio sp.]|nr:AAA family ATPase [Butyrivibrio sp.]